MPTKIEWTDETWNPIVGCSKVSPGCANCYAERMARRLAPRVPGYDVVIDNGRWNGKTALRDLVKPLKWKKPRMVFVNSMGDLFHKSISDRLIIKVFAVMAVAWHHTFQLLTKRPERMRDWISDRENYDLVLEAANPIRKKIEAGISWPLHNVWVGGSVENQARANIVVPLILQTPAAIRFVSVEPMLGPVDLKSVQMPDGDFLGDALHNHGRDAGIDWAICGAETGPGKRPMELDWARSLRDQCAAAGAPFFFKKDSQGITTLDGKTHNAYPKS